MDNTAIGKKQARMVFVVGFGRRLTAAIVDGLIVIIVTWLLATIIGAIAVFSGVFDVGVYKVAGESDPMPIVWFVALSGILVSLLYYVGYWSKSGQTIGKLSLDLKVISVDGSPVTVGAALLRYLGYIVSGAVLSLGFVWIELDKKRQGWHDKIASTFVVYSEESFSSQGAVDIVADDPDRGKLLFAIWAVLLIVAPGALLAGLWLLGPVINRSLTDFLVNLR